MRFEPTSVHSLLEGDPEFGAPVEPEPFGLRNFIGVVLSAAAFTILLACGAGRAGTTFVDVDEVRREARGAVLMQDLLQAISAYPYETVAQLGEPDAARRLRADPDFKVDVGVTSLNDGVLRIEARLLRSATAEPVGEFVTYRRRT